MNRPLKTLTVAQLVAQLQTLPPDAEVRAWLPGSTIALAGAFAYRGAVRIEGNIDPGSALDDISPRDIGDDDALAEREVERAAEVYAAVMARSSDGQAAARAVLALAYATARAIPSWEWRQIIDALRSSKGDSPASAEDLALAAKLEVRL